MKKLLYLIPVLGLLFILSACVNINAVEKNIHDYQPSYDEEAHFDLCDCGEKKNIEAHQFEEEILYDATCETDGKIKYTCKCGYTKEETIPALGHNPVTINGTAASCDDSGLSDGIKCSRCEKILKEQTTLSKLNHKFTEWEVDTPATCISKGKEKRECEHCHLEEYRDIERIAHTSTPYTDLESDCTHEGHTGGSYCSFCNQELTPYTTVDKKDHDYTEWEIDTPATCISKGKERRECKVCHHEEYRDVEKTDHTPTPGEAKESTCTEHGHTAGSYCSFCHIELEAPVELPLKSHEYTVETVTVQPTYTDEGTKIVRCANCTDSYEESIPRKELTQSVWQNALSNLNNKTIIFTYMDITFDKTVTLSQKNDVFYCKVVNNKTGFIEEYYHNYQTALFTYDDGYRHSTYESKYDLFEYEKNNLLKYITESSAYYGDMEWDSDYKYYKCVNETFTYGPYKNTAITLGIQLKPSGVLDMFALSNNALYIGVEEVIESSTVSMPTNYKEYHTFGTNYDGTAYCTYCNHEYYAFDNGTYTVYQDKSNDDNYQFFHNEWADYELYRERVELTYSKTNNIKKFINLSFKGYNYTQIKSFTINSSKVLKITYEDKSELRLLLLNDGTCIKVSSDSVNDPNAYNGNPIGKYFDLLCSNTDDLSETRRFYIKSASELTEMILEETDIYVINNKTVLSPNSRKFEKLFGTTFSSYSNGKKHNGSTGYIYFILDENLNLNIYYEGLSDSMKAFSVVTFQGIHGKYTSSGSDFYIYFMGDNQNYKLHYTGNVEITKV